MVLTMNANTSIVMCLAILLQLRAVLSQIHSDNTDLCPTPINASATDETLTGAIMAQLPCSSDFSDCDVKNLVTISMDSFTYDGAKSLVNISLSTNTEEEMYYYRLCSVLGDTNDVRLLQCLKSNQSSFITDLYWNVTGRNELTVHVFNDSGYFNFVDCAHETVLVANNSGLNLKVKVSQPKPQNINPIGEPVIPIGPAFVGPVCTSSLTTKHYQIGNLTFKSSVNVTNFTEVHFTYNFGDGHTLRVVQNHSNVSTENHLYSSKGLYHYTVDALVVLNDDELAVHSAKNNNISVYETLTEHNIIVGGDNSVQVGVSDVAIVLSGSFPVTYCWCMVFPNSTACSRVPEVNSTSKGNITCITVTEPLNQDQTVYTVQMNLTMLGTHRILANFSNIVDCKNESFSFYVYSPPSPVVIISSTTIGVLAALLAIVVVVIIVIVTVIIPYRRYKYRMTETANFRFIELSESTGTIKGKVRRASRNFADYFRSSRQDRVGLVNTESNDFTSSDRLINRKRDNLVTFAPYDSL